MSQPTAADYAAAESTAFVRQVAAWLREEFDSETPEGGYSDAA